MSLKFNYAPVWECHNQQKLGHVSIMQGDSVVNKLNHHYANSYGIRLKWLLVCKKFHTVTLSVSVLS